MYNLYIMQGSGSSPPLNVECGIRNAELKEKMTLRTLRFLGVRSLFRIRHSAFRIYPSSLAASGRSRAMSFSPVGIPLASQPRRR